MADPLHEDVFAQVAVEIGLLTKEQVEECRALSETLTKAGLKGRSLAQIAVEKGILSREQVRQIAHVMRERGVRQTFAGYALLDKLGGGAMGVVYKAEQLSLQRTVAVKFLNPDLARDAGYVERFRREALLAARLSHPNAVQIYDVGEEGGRYFIVMEFVDGKSLSTHVCEGPMDEARALQIIHDVARALGEAHGRGIVHRDIKPANILIRPDGVPKLADLGVAKDVSRATTVGTLTGAGVTVGTPLYMSPEQCSGEANVDARSDIYSLGITLFRMVCGKDPFEGPTPLVVMAKQVNEPLPDPRIVNPALNEGTAQLIRDMTAKDREARIGTCAELISRIELITSGQPALAAPATPPPVQATGEAPPLPAGASSAAARARRKETVLIAAGAVVVLAAVAGIVAMALKGPKVKPPPPAFAPLPEAAAQRRWHYSALLVQAVNAEAARDWDRALQLYREAADFADNREQVDSGMRRVEAAKAQDGFLRQYQAKAGEGARLAGEQKWAEAKAAYEGARAIAEKLTTRPADYDSLVSRIAEAQAGLEGAVERRQLLEKYRGQVEEGRRLSGAGDWRAAKAAYENARNIAGKLEPKPQGYADLPALIKDCDAKLTAPVVSAPTPAPTPVVTKPPEPEKGPTETQPPKVQQGGDTASARLREIQCRAGVSSISFSADGRLLATGHGHDEAVRVWDVATGKQAREIAGLKNVIAYAAFSPGPPVLAFNEGTQVKLCDVATGRVVSVGGLATEHQNGAAFLPKGGIIAVGVDGNVALVDLQKGEVLLLKPPMGNTVADVAFDRTGSLVAAGDHSGGVRVWDMKTMRPVCEFSGGKQRVWSLSFHPTRPLLATASLDGRVGVFDVQAGKSVCSFEDTAGFVCFSPNGRLLAAAGKAMRLWDTQTWKELVAFGEDWRSGGTVYERRLAFSPDGKTLACQGPKPEVLSFWSVDKLLPALAPEMLTTGGEKKGDAGPRPGVGEAAARPAEKPAPPGGPPAGALLRQLKVGPTLTSVSLSADGRMLATGHRELNTVKLWDAATGKQVRELANLRNNISYTEFAPAAPVLAYNNYVSVALLDVATWRGVERSCGNDHQNCGAFHPGGRLFALGMDNWLVLLDTQSGEVVRKVQFDATVRSVAFNKAGALCATGEDGGAVRLWDMKTFRQIREFEGHADAIVSVSFHPTKPMLASGDKKGYVNVWDMQSGDAVRQFSEEVGGVVEFCADGKALVICGRRLSLWDTQTWEKRADMGEGWLDARGPERPMTVAADGKVVVCQGPRGDEVSFWGVASLLAASAPGKADHESH